MTKDITAEHVLNDLRYLTLLARSFPTVADASTEIINLEAILNLPKGTEHFLSDIHGEHQAFNHVLKNASGAIKRKVNEIFSNTLRDFEKKELCTLIYYPEQKLELIRQREKDLDDWYLITLNQLVRVCRNVSSKYTRSKVRKALPKEFSYIIQELLHESSDEPNKSAYVDQIINTIISTGRANDFIIAMCNLIQRLTIDLLHIIGDIYDRGPGAHIIMDTLCNYHNFDIQWGNHDILWMGAAAGNAGSIANVIRMCMRYGNLATLEDGYGINLLPLATFAMEVYGDDPCELFIPRTNASDATFDEKTTQLIARMHKAITIIQFKLEGEIIRRRPEFGMDDRLLLHHIDLHRGTIRIEGKEYELKDKNWPTLNAKDPYALSIEEEELMRRIKHSFECSEKLKKHMRCLFTHGSMYQVCNSNLLFHASVPMNPDGTLKAIRIEGTNIRAKPCWIKWTSWCAPPISMPTTARRRTSRWITSGIFGKAKTPLSSTRAGWRLSNAASSTTNRCRRRKKAPTIPSGKKNRSVTCCWTSSASPAGTATSSTDMSPYAPSKARTRSRQTGNCLSSTAASPKPTTRGQALQVIPWSTIRAASSLYSTNRSCRPTRPSRRAKTSVRPPSSSN